MPTAPSWDFIVGMFFAVTVAYGFILQRDRILTTLLSIYVGIVVSQVWSGTLHQFVNGDKTVFGQFFVRSSASPQTIQIILFLVTIGIMSTKSGLISNRVRSMMTPIELFGYSFLTAGLVLTTLLAFLPDVTRANIIEHSHLAARVMDFQVWWAVAPVLLMLLTGGGRRRVDPYTE